MVLFAMTEPLDELSSHIKRWAKELELQDCAITDTDLGEHETHLLNWLSNGFHGDMNYMERHGLKRSRPAQLEPGTLRIISVRLDYFPPEAKEAHSVMNDPMLGYVSRYALGRDYHKVLRKKLQQLATRISDEIGSFGYRVFVDSAPVLEKAIAEKAGLGWIGKHSNLLVEDAGSWFFLGELYTDLPLRTDPPRTSGHCGTCTACIQACPTDAIVAPYRVDARRCISYLTIELRGSIPVEFRRAMGNRIYGCDDCQLVCPFNKFSEPTELDDFAVRHNLDAAELLSLFSWTENDFNKRLEGSAIRRIGFPCWQRNIAIALGNANYSESITAALENQRGKISAMVDEHIDWAIDEQRQKQAQLT